MPPTNHAILSASSAARWIACPPSARITEHMPDKPSPYAEEGTQAHAVCERVLQHSLREWTDCDDTTVLPEDYTGSPEEMAVSAKKYADFIREIWLSFDDEPSVFIEQHVDFSRWVPQGFGTCDCLLIGDGALHIVDFKYGMGVPVSPERNPQMMCYALGAFELFRATDQIDTVRMSIVQPRIQEEPETFELTSKQLIDWAENTLAPAAQLAWKGKGDLNPGEKQCRFCKAYPTCRAWKDKYGPLADFNPLPEPTLLQPEELGPWLNKIQGIAAYAKDLEAYALEQLVAGNAIPGWKAVEGRSTRQWATPEAQEAAFKAIEGTGINEALLYTREPVSLTAAEKLVGKKQFTTICGEYISKPAGAPKLAPESDSRPPINKLDGFKEEATETNGER